MKAFLIIFLHICFQAAYSYHYNVAFPLFSERTHYWFYIHLHFFTIEWQIFPSTLFQFLPRKLALCRLTLVDSILNVMAQSDARKGTWVGNWWLEWVGSTLHTTLEHGVSSITTAVAHTSAASSRMNWRPCRFKWTRPFRRKKKSGFCSCAITFQLASNIICILFSLVHLSCQYYAMSWVCGTFVYMLFCERQKSPLLGTIWNSMHS